MKQTVVMAMAVMLVFAFAAQAETRVTVDLSKLPPEVATQVLKAQKAEEVLPDKETVEQYVDLGTKMGQAIGAASRELSVGVNEFIRTPAGILTIAVIGWKMIGHDLWNIVGGTLAWLVMTGIWMWSFSNFHMSKKIKDGGGNIRYVPRYEFRTDEARVGSACVHVVIECILTFLCLITVFG